MILLDTHAWIWWISAPDQLSPKARRAIDEAKTIGISAMTCWEISMLVEKDRIELNSPVELWLKLALARPRTELWPLSPAISVKATQLRNFHEDPVDRILVATALDYGVPLITKDRKIHSYDLVKTIW